VAYDVFISYRRQGSAEVARSIQAKLYLSGKRAFLDVDDLKAGYFNQSLLETIAETPNFIVVLSSDCLDRCVNEDDWLRQEIAQAIRTKRNIIPVMMPGFTFPSPQKLPDELRELKAYQSVKYDHDYFDAMINRIIKYFRNQETTKHSIRGKEKRPPHSQLIKIEGKQTTKRRIVIGSVAAVLIAVLLAAITLSNRWQIPPTLTETPVKIEKDKARFILSNYTIRIYYYRRVANLNKAANNIQDSLKQYGLNGGQIDLLGRDDNFFEKNVTPLPSGYEIRYTPGSEDEAAEALHMILKEVYPAGAFRKVESINNPDKVISIFLGLEPQG
jgi:TIR domain-containing protein